MIICMISGSIARQPETRQSKNGNNYTLASIRVQTAEGDMFTSVTAFEPLAGTLAGLQRGDPITIVGVAKVSTYQGRDGDTKAGLSITASRIITISNYQAPPKERKSKGDGQGRRLAAAGAPDPREYADEFADSVPF